MARLKAEISKPLNFEMAVTDEMVAHRAEDRSRMRCASCRSGGRRSPPKAASTSIGQHNALVPVIARFNDAGMRVSLFIGADPRRSTPPRAPARR